VYVKRHIDEERAEEAEEETVTTSWAWRTWARTLRRVPVLPALTSFASLTRD